MRKSISKLAFTSFTMMTMLFLLFSSCKKDEPTIVNDIGIFASDDPVACDKAAADMIIQSAKGDIFKQAFPSADYYMNQLIYAQKIGLGNMEYDLVQIK